MALPWRHKLSLLCRLFFPFLLLANTTLVYARQQFHHDLLQHCPLTATTTTYCPTSDAADEQADRRRGPSRRGLRKSLGTATPKVAICVESEQHVLTTICVNHEQGGGLDEQNAIPPTSFSFYACGCCPGAIQEWCRQPPQEPNTTTTELMLGNVSTTPTTNASCSINDDEDMIVYEWRNTSSYLDTISNQPDYSPGDAYVFYENPLSTTNFENDDEKGWSSTGRCIVLQEAATPYNEFCDVTLTFPGQGTLHVAGSVARQHLVVLRGTGCFVHTTGVRVTELVSTLQSSSSLANVSWAEYLAYQFTTANETVEVTSFETNTNTTNNNTILHDECMEMRSSPSTTDTTLSWFHTLADQAIDWDSNGASTGDMFVFDQDIIQTSQPIEGGSVSSNSINGILEGECMFLQNVDVNDLYCAMSFHMGRNHDNLLVVEGPFHQMVILGGTGCFQDATGVVSGSYPSSPMAQYNITFDNEEPSNKNTNCTEDVFDTVWTMPAGARTLVDYGQDGRADRGDAILFDDITVTIPRANQTAIQGALAARCFVLTQQGDKYCTYIVNLPGGLLAIRGIQNGTMAIIAGSGCYQKVKGIVDAKADDDQLSFSFLNLSY